MIGLAWACLAAAAAWFWHRHLEWFVVAAAMLWLVVPGLARDTFALGPLDLNPGAVLVLVTVAAQLARNPRTITRVLAASPALVVMMAAVALLATVQTLVLSRGPEGVMFAVEQLWCPMGLFLLTGAALLERPAFARRVTAWLAGALALQGVLATVQEVVGRPLLHEAAYQEQYWFREDFDRWMGTTDHPLVLSLLVLLTAPLLVRPMAWKWRLAALAGMTAAMATTQSRVGVVLFAAEVLYVVTRARAGRASRLAILVLVVGSTVTAWAMGAFDAVILRMTTDDGGSAEARTLAFDYFSRHFGEYTWLGLGMNQNILLAKAVGLGTSFENSFIMSTIDMGLPLALVYYGSMLACIVVGLVRGSTRGAWLGAAVGFGYIETFSALGTRNAGSAWLWIILALTLYSIREETWEDA